MHPTLTDEQEPGVYVRNDRPDHDLDFLWDRERKRHSEPERFHLGFFVGGMVVGIALTLVTGFIYLSGNNMLKPPVKAQPTSAMIEEKSVAAAKDAGKAASNEKPAVNFSLWPETKKPTDSTEAEVKPQPEAPLKARYYEVQSGDTLGSIAIKFYDSSDPALIERIQRANQLTDADTLQLGQKLVIPPRDY